MRDRPDLLTPDERLRVFVSSAMGEFAEERDALEAAISRLRLIPVLFEQAAKPYPPRDVYRAYLDRSHVFVGVYGTEYGWVAPDMEVSGVEDEYDLAAAKPRLIYVKDVATRDPRMEGLIQRIEAEGAVSYRRFSTTEELVAAVESDLMGLLSERFGLDAPPPGGPPDLLSDVRDRMAEGVVVERDAVMADLSAAVDAHGRLLMTGEPGAGKTYLVGALSEQSDRPVHYVSLLNRSVQRAASHLANRLRVGRRERPEVYPSEAEALDGLERELSRGDGLVVVDDVDQNPEAAAALAGVTWFGTRALLVARSEPGGLGWPTFRVPPFERVETERFLAAAGVSLAPGALQRLLTASRGNPMYLSYYAAAPVDPLPDGLEAYQRSLWERLGDEAEEVVSIVGLAEWRIRPVELGETLGVGHQPAVLRRRIQDAAPLVRTVAGALEIFHPAFRDFVRGELSSAGLDELYHERLGWAAAAQGNVVGAAVHLLRADVDDATDYLRSGAEAANVGGAWALSLELAAAAYERTSETDPEEAGHARFIKARTRRELGELDAARQAAEEAVALFRRASAWGWARTVGGWLATLLVDEGKVREAEAQLRTAIEAEVDASPGADVDEMAPFRLANLHLQLSYLYLQRGAWAQAAEEAERSLEAGGPFEGELAGVTARLNLAGAVGHLGDYERQLALAEHVIEIAQRHRLPRLELAGRNNLTSAYRYLDRYDEAIASAERAVAMAQQMGVRDAEATNLGNLGNIYKDLERWDEAEASYLEALRVAEEAEADGSVAFALDLLARLYVAVERFEEALHDGERAVAAHRQRGSLYRLAGALDAVATARLGLGEPRRSAALYVEAGRVYSEVEDHENATSSFENAADAWESAGEAARAAGCYAAGDRAWVLRYAPELVGSVPDLDATLAFADRGVFFEAAVDAALAPGTTAPLAGLTRMAVAYAEVHGRRDVYDAVVDRLVRDGSPRALVALAAVIEQARTFVRTTDAVDALARCVAAGVLGLQAGRARRDGLASYTLGLPWGHPLVVQVHALTDEAVGERMALAVAVLYVALGDEIGTVVEAEGGNGEDGFQLYVFTESEFEREVVRGLGGFDIGDEPVTTTMVAGPPEADGVPPPPGSLILADDYDDRSSEVASPDNRTFAYLVRAATAALVSHAVMRAGTGADPFRLVHDLVLSVFRTHVLPGAGQREWTRSKP